MITLLVASHKTTSGLLSFTFYYLLTHPVAYAKAQKEVDAVVSGGPITVNHLASLPYLNAVFRESLRLTPPIPTIMLTNKEDTVLSGRHYIKASTPIIALITAVHQDPSVYSSNADKFQPERMLNGEFTRRNKQYPNC
jgi:cytochrome P450/NADPH-cytochrome P450 reductase